DMVRSLREKGVDAYYYHTSTASSVCVGCWQADAVSIVEAAQQDNDPTKDVVVLPAGTSESYEKLLIDNGAQTLKSRVEILDPTINQMLIRFPAHDVNYEHREVVDPITQQPKLMDHAFLVRIPHPDPLDTVVDSGAPALPPLQPQHADPALGQLR